MWATQAGFGRSNARAEGMRTARSSQLGATQLIHYPYFFSPRGSSEVPVSPKKQQECTFFLPATSLKKSLCMPD